MIKVIVVEDEIRIREGIVNLISKIGAPFHVIGEAEDGLIGLQLARQFMPDLIISDIRMVKMDGLKMIEELKKTGEDPEIILLTAYSDFEYARSAIEFGVYRYLLKPIDYFEFKESLIQVKKIIDKKQETIFSDQIYSYLSENTEQITFRDPCGIIQIHLLDKPDKEVIAGLFELTSEPYIVVDRDLYLFINASDTAERGLYVTKLMESLNSIYREEQFCIGFKYCDSDNPLIKKEMKRVMEEGVIEGGSVSLPSDKNLFHSGKTYLKHQRQLISYRKAGQEFGESAKKFISEVRRDKDRLTPKQIKDILIQLLFQWRNNNSSLNVEPFTEAVLRINQAYLFLEIERAIKTFIDKISTQNNTVSAIPLPVKRALGLVEQRYAQGVTLEEIADSVGVTKEYLSTQFHQATGHTFTEYIKETRLAIAKDLLLETDMKIYEVAERVGIKDSKYFGQLFKQHTGLTPREYQRVNSV